MRYPGDDSNGKKLSKEQYWRMLGEFRKKGGNNQVIWWKKTRDSLYWISKVKKFLVNAAWDIMEHMKNIEIKKITTLLERYISVLHTI